MHSAFIKKTKEINLYDSSTRENLGTLSGLQTLLLYAYYKKFTNKEISNLLRKLYYIEEELNLDFEKYMETRFWFILSNFETIIFDIELKDLIQDLEKYVYLDRVKYFTPVKMVISLTNSCAHKCSYCYAHKKILPKRELNYDKIKDIVDYCCTNNIKEIDFTGGDVFTRNDMFDIFELLNSKGIKCNISTKIVLNKENLQKLIQTNVIKSFQFSLDSLYQEENDMLVKKVNVKEALLFLRSLVKESKFEEIKVNSVITKYNICNILDLSDKLFDIGVDKHCLSPYTFSKGINNEVFFASTDQFNTLFNKIKTRSDNHKLEFPISLNRTKEINDVIVCNAGVDGMVINNDGNVFLCERMCGDITHSIGNVYNSDLRSIWNNKKIYNYLLPNRELFKKSKCYNCDKFTDCVYERGICYIHSELLSGEFYGPDNYCTTKKHSRRIY
ncbi:radical SAM protein [Lagierella sp.]|uniref:radical SAM/SPASM domain-containing protein n=1 Tax=Lagierella sp. TaxID=2849657 RepID=UPI0026256310|nr:radical SAM protein [Lagierella sp.]